MTAAPDRLRDRIADQFSYRGDRADVWCGFDLVLDTDRFLNLGYSRWYQPHVVGSSQRRLATKIGATVRDHLPTAGRIRLLDVGCGRGGPAIHLAERFDFAVTGIDLVPYNVARARENARTRSDVEFVVGDASALPFAPGSVAACTAIDSLVYVPDRAAVVRELSEVLADGGIVVLSDLVVQSGVSAAARRAVEEFADAWDMPTPETVAGYERLLADGGFEVRAVEDVTPNSVGRFRKWTASFLRLVDSPANHLVERLLGRYGLDPSTVIAQVRRAHGALPYLGHAILVAKTDG